MLSLSRHIFIAVGRSSSTPFCIGVLYEMKGIDKRCNLPKKISPTDTKPGGFEKREQLHIASNDPRKVSQPYSKLLWARWHETHSVRSENEITRRVRIEVRLGRESGWPSIEWRRIHHPWSRVWLWYKRWFLYARPDVQKGAAWARVVRGSAEGYQRVSLWNLQPTKEIHLPTKMLASWGILWSFISEFSSRVCCAELVLGLSRVSVVSGCAECGGDVSDEMNESKRVPQVLDTFWGMDKDVW